MVTWGLRVGARDYKGVSGNMGGEEYVHYVGCGDGLTGVYMCQNSSNCAPYVHFININYTSIELCFKN